MTRETEKTSKTFDDDIISVNSDTIVIFFDLWPMWSNPEAGFQTHSLQKFTFSLIITFYLTKIENGTKTYLKQLSHNSFEKRYHFCQKSWYFEKNAGISNIKRILALKLIFSKMTYVCVLTDQFHVSNIILTSLRQGGYTLPQNEPLKSPPTLGLNACAKYEIFPDTYIRMRVDLDKSLDKDAFNTIKTAILCTFTWKKSTKISFGAKLIR